MSTVALVQAFWGEMDPARQVAGSPAIAICRHPRCSVRERPAAGGSQWRIAGRVPLKRTGATCADAACAGAPSSGN